MGLGSVTAIYDAKTVTPSDTVDLPDGPCRGLLLSAAATVKITTGGKTEVSLPLQAGYNPIIASRVWATPAPGVTVIALY